MKLAIIGSGPLAILCAQHFDRLGAEVTLFQKNALGGNIRFLKDHFPEMEIDYLTQKKSIHTFWKEDLVPAILSLEEGHLTRAGEVLRVHKRFLHQNENVSGKSRLHDLFRVIYSVNPKEAILKQLEENPEMFKQLGDQVVSSLHLPVESFQDYDLVIEARGFGRDANSIGPSNTLALNENNLKNSSSLYYEKDIFKNLILKEQKHLVLIGEGDSAILTLIKCKEWLFKNPNHSLSWITSKPLGVRSENNWLNSELEKILFQSQEKFDEDKRVFEKKMFEWRDLEDHVKDKIPKPIEPTEKLKIFQGYDVTSVDRLLDREGVFATIESPDFRDHAAIKNDLKTLAAEALLIARGVDVRDTVARGLTEDEPGFYRLDALNLSDGLSQIKIIEEKILSYFSRAE